MNKETVDKHLSSKRKYLEYCDADIVQCAKEVTSIAQLLKKLNLKPLGGNFDTIKRKVAKLQVDTSHWTGSAWSRGKQLKRWADYKRPASLKKILLKTREHKCECCGLSDWLGEQITLEVHHIDGDRCNNNMSNLQLLCPNCHSFTDNWRGKKKASML